MARTQLDTRQGRRLKRHRRVRKKIHGSPERPRLVVFRSINQMEGQIVDDITGVTLVGVSTLAPQLREHRQQADGATKSEMSRMAGKLLAERAREKGVSKVVFDRGGYLYHGRVKAFAEGAREGGLEF